MSLRKKSTYEARKLRKTMTLPEVILWNELKASKLGVPFRKQHPIGIYITDFCCSEKMLVVEVDGKVHDLLDQALHDQSRDETMKALGYRVLRFSAKDVLGNMLTVLDTIAGELHPLHHPAGGPPPRERGGFV